MLEDRYRILGTIGTGGMATVYRAEDLSTGEMVVIKKLHPHLASDPGFVERFSREAKILSSLRHRNIVRLRDYFKEEGDYYLVLEYVEGITLKRLIEEKGALPLPVAVYILYEVADALGYAHRRGILHRDVKSGNIMVGTDGGVKIMDFGLALVEGYPSITEPGVYVGTPEYLAPEILAGERPSVQSDLYALGVMFYEMLAGKNPFKGATPYETINKVLYEKLPPVRKTFPEYPLWVEELVRKLMAREPKQRFGSADEVVKVLRLHLVVGRRQVARFLLDPSSIQVKGYDVSPLYTVPLWLWLLLLLSIVAMGVNLVIRERKMNTPFVGGEWDTFVVREPGEHAKGETFVSGGEVSDESATGVAQEEKDTVSREEVATPPDTGEGYLRVVISPWGDVEVDGKIVGRTPIAKPIVLPAGKHVIRLVHPNRVPWEDTVYFAPGDTVRLQVELQKAYGYLRIVVVPWAKVYIDGREVGETPLGKALRLSIGEHTLMLLNPGYERWVERIHIMEGETLNRVISLQ